MKESYTFLLFFLLTVSAFGQQPELITQSGHFTTAMISEISASRRLFATSSEDRTVVVWDYRSRKVLRHFRGFTRPVYAMAFSLDDHLLATESQDSTIRIWDLESGNLLKAIPFYDKTERRKGIFAVTHDPKSLFPTLALSFSADAKSLIRYGQTTVISWGIASGDILSQKEAPWGTNATGIFSPDKKAYVANNKVWDLDKLEAKADYTLSSPSPGQIIDRKIMAIGFNGDYILYRVNRKVSSSFREMGREAQLGEGQLPAASQRVIRRKMDRNAGDPAGMLQDVLGDKPPTTSKPSSGTTTPNKPDKEDPEDKLNNLKNSVVGLFGTKNKQSAEKQADAVGDTLQQTMRGNNSGGQHLDSLHYELVLLDTRTKTAQSLYQYQGPHQYDIPYALRWGNAAFSSDNTHLVVGDLNLFEKGDVAKRVLKNFVTTSIKKQQVNTGYLDSLTYRIVVFHVPQKQIVKAFTVKSLVGLELKPVAQSTFMVSQGSFRPPFLFDWKTETVIRDLAIGQYRFTGHEFVADSLLLVRGRSGLQLFDLTRLQSLATYNGLQDDFSASCLSTDRSTIFFGTFEGNVGRWNWRNNEIQKLYSHAYKVTSLAYHPSGSLLSSENPFLIGSFLPGAYNKCRLVEWNPKGKKKEWEWNSIYRFGNPLANQSSQIPVEPRPKPLRIGKEMAVTAMALSPGGNYLATYISSIGLVAKAAELVTIINSDAGDERMLTMLNDRRKWTPAPGELKIWSVNSQKDSISLAGIDGADFSALKFTPDEKYLLGADGSSVVVWEIGKKAVLWRKDLHTNLINALAISPDGKTVATGGNDRQIRFTTILTGEPLTTWSMMESEITSLNYSQNGRIMVSAHKSGQIIFWDLKTGQRKLQIIQAQREGEYVVVNADGYYLSTQYGRQSVAFRKGLRVYPFEQFDLKYNRPDLVMATMNEILYGDRTKNAKLQLVYAKARQRRLNLYNIKDEKQLDFTAGTPEVAILNREALPLTTNQPKITLKIKADVPQGSLNRLNIWVNGVPIYGMGGLDVGKKPLLTLAKEVEITLSEGNNVIQVASYNTNGTESLRDITHIVYTPATPRKPNLYVVVLSVGQYDAKDMNLTYSVKDGRDMARLFQTKQGTSYNKVFIDTLFNYTATLVNLKKIKTRLLTSHVDDQVVFFVSGHGLLDKNQNFFFATSKLNFANPGVLTGGIAYDELENLLDGIPARKKLLLMDACHSGEVDRETAQNPTGASTSGGTVKSYAFKNRGTVLGTNQLGLDNSFELMRELFSDLRKGSGTVVIAAAAGNRFAYESDRWQNGVFTYSILDGLQNQYANTDKGSPAINVSELRAYVVKTVEKLTNGAQKPTTRQENLEFDYAIW